jgi:hypothetical protein
MSVKFLRIAVAAFFILLGVAGILPNVEESVFSLNNRNMMVELIFGIVELISGAVLLFGLFNYNGVKLLHKASLVILIFWVARVILTKLVWSNPANLGFSGLFQWLLVVSLEVMIGAVIWVLVQAYDRRW